MWTIVQQPSVEEVQRSLEQDDQTITLTIRNSETEQTEERIILVTAISKHRGTQAISFEGRSPRKVGKATNYWDVKVTNFTGDPVTAGYSEFFFFV